MSHQFHVALAALLLSAGACAIEGDFGPSDEQADSLEGIELRVPDVPTDIRFETADTIASNSQSIAYGHCDPAETDDDGAITIDCPKKWTEVAWFHISRDEARILMDQEHSSLEFQLSVANSTIPDDSLRFSVHATGDSGIRRKLMSEANLFDGESAGVALEDAAFDVYLARGENSALIWGTGAIEFSMATNAQ